MDGDVLMPTRVQLEPMDVLMFAMLQMNTDPYNHEYLVGQVILCHAMLHIKGVSLEGFPAVSSIQ
jgi:hypothetical protein